jgi:hypothetical protein
MHAEIPSHFCLLKVVQENTAIHHDHTDLAAALRKVVAVIVRAFLLLEDAAVSDKQQHARAPLAGKIVGVCGREETVASGYASPSVAGM